MIQGDSEFTLLEAKSFYIIVDTGKDEKNNEEK